MTKIFLISFLFLWNNILFAQNPKDSIDHKTTDFKKNAFFVELGGRCGISSLNYEIRFFKINSSYKTICFGAAPFLPLGGFSGGMQIPISVNDIIGKKNIKFQIGIGIVNAIDFTPEPPTKEERKQLIESGHIPSPPLRIIINPIVGCRYETTKCNFFASIGFTPMIFNNPCNKYINGHWKSGYEILPWAGICIGYKFNT